MVSEGDQNFKDSRSSHLICLPAEEVKLPFLSILPIFHLFQNVLIFRTEAALIFVDLIQVLFTRIYIDEFYDCDNEKGLLLLKATDFVKPCIFSIERQQSLAFLQSKNKISYTSKPVDTNNDFSISEKIFCVALKDKTYTKTRMILPGHQNIFKTIERK